MQQAAHALQWTIGNALAVPSDGSNLMQLLLPPIATSTTPSCSTLRRVEPNATTYTYAQPFVQRSCSTLRRVEPNATLWIDVSTTEAVDLQYPQTGRT